MAFMRGVDVSGGRGRVYIYIYIYVRQINLHLPAPSNRSPLVALGDLEVVGGDLLEGPGM